MLNTYFCDKNEIAKIQNLTVSPYFPQIITDKLFSRVAYRNWEREKHENVISK